MGQEMLNALTVVFYTRNRVDFLLNYSLKTLNETDGEFDVLILEDDSEQKLRIHDTSWLRRPISICEIPAKSSCAHLWNMGMVLSKTRYTMLCNDDILFTSGWAKEVNGYIGSGYEYILLYQHGAFILDKRMVAKNLLYADERFGFGSHEDCDLFLRGINCNAKIVNASDRQIIKHAFDGKAAGGGWAKTENIAYYAKKWGTYAYSPYSQDYSLKKIADVDWYPSFTEKWKKEYP